MFALKILLPAFAVLVFCQPAAGAERDLNPEERIELIRGLTAEYATAKVLVPRSRRALKFESTGSWDEKQWESAAEEYGPAARVGDLLRISKVSLERDKIVLEINGGFRGGRRWYERIQVGVGSQPVPVSRPDGTEPVGTSIAVHFPKRLPPLTAAEVKSLLAPVLDFERRSATEQYVESLPAPIQEAIKEKRAVEGMNRDQVLLALGRPERKVRETKDGQELEDWIFGVPPGRMVFVTFDAEKAIRVKETYAGLGAQAPPLPSPR